MFTVMDYTTKESLKRQLIFNHTEMNGNQWLLEDKNIHLKIRNTTAWFAKYSAMMSLSSIYYFTVN